MLYFGYRYYNPITGRWLSRDPLHEKGGKNLYSYVDNDPTDSIDALGEIAIMTCNRYKWNGRFAQICTLQVIGPCRADCCQAEADRVNSATSVAALQPAIAALGDCLRAHNSGKLDITQYGPIYTNFDTNTPANPGSEEYGTNGPVPPRIYRVLPKVPSDGSGDTDIRIRQPDGKFKINFHTGTPSLTDLNQSYAGVIYSGGARRTGIRIHYPPFSNGCATCNTGTSPNAGEGFIEQVMNQQRGCGGMLWEITENGEPPPVLRNTFEHPDAFPSLQIKKY